MISDQAQHIQSISEENKKLHDHIVTITLAHEQILLENKLLNENLQKKQTQLIQSKLKQGNLAHNLTHLKKQFEALQKEYQHLYNHIYTDNRLEMRDIFKKQAYLLMDLTKIQKQSYREEKKKQNEQVRKYQTQINLFFKQNQRLRLSVIDSTSSYNQQIYQLKQLNIQANQKCTKLQQLLQIKKNNGQCFITQTNQNSKILSLETKLLNQRNKLKLQQDLNKQLFKRNDQLFLRFRQAQLKVKDQIVSKAKDQIHTIPNPYLLQARQNIQNLSYIIQLLYKNQKLQTQLSSLSQKYITLTQTYPQLIQSEQQIMQLLECHKNFVEKETLLQKIQQLTHQSIQSLKHQLEKVQHKFKAYQSQYKDLIKQKAQDEYTYKTIIKRFNQIFIQMNPYFDVYQYQMIDLKQENYNVFNRHKDYKTLRQYENTICQFKSQKKDMLFKHNLEIENLIKDIQIKNKSINDKQNTIKLMKQEIKKLSQLNISLKDSFSLFRYHQPHNQKGDMIQYQQYKTNQLAQINAAQRITKLQEQITIPLLRKLIDELHSERQKLIQIIQIKDEQNSKLFQQMKQALLNQPIQIIKMCQQKYSTDILSSQVYNFKNNYESIKNRQQQIQSISLNVQKFQSQIMNQHNLYQLQIKKYQTQTATQIAQLTSKLNQWRHNYDQLKNKTIKDEVQRTVNKFSAQNRIISQENEEASKKRITLQENNDKNDQQNPLNFNLLGVQSLANLKNVSMGNQQGANKQIGQSTVSTLTSTLKQYQSQLSQVLQMCLKLSNQHNELKTRLSKISQIQQQNHQLKQQSWRLDQQVKQLKKKLSAEHQTIQAIDKSYKASQGRWEQIKYEISKDNHILRQELLNQKKSNSKLLTQLADIKQKMFQVAKRTLNQGTQASIGKNQFETIVVMHQNKNKEVQLLAQKNKSLQTKVEKLMDQLNSLNKKANQKSSLEMSPMQKAEIKQLSDLLKDTNIMSLLKKANTIVEEKEKETQKKNMEQQKNVLNNSMSEEKSLEY